MLGTFLTMVTELVLFCIPQVSILVEELHLKSYTACFHQVTMNLLGNYVVHLWEVVHGKELHFQRSVSNYAMLTWFQAFYIHLANYFQFNEISAKSLVLSNDPCNI